MNKAETTDIKLSALVRLTVKIANSAGVLTH